MQAHCVKQAQSNEVLYLNISRSVADKNFSANWRTLCVFFQSVKIWTDALGCSPGARGYGSVFSGNLEEVRFQWDGFLQVIKLENPRTLPTRRITQIISRPSSLRLASSFISFFDFLIKIEIALLKLINLPPE